MGVDVRVQWGGVGCGGTGWGRKGRGREEERKAKTKQKKTAQFQRPVVFFLWFEARAWWLKESSEPRLWESETLGGAEASPKNKESIEGTLSPCGERQEAGGPSPLSPVGSRLGLRPLVYPKSLTDVTHTGALPSQSRPLPQATLYQGSFREHVTP